MVMLLATHPFNDIALRVKLGLTSYEELSSGPAVALPSLASWSAFLEQVILCQLCKVMTKQWGH